MQTTQENWAETIGKSAFESIAEMVRAVALDWDRLEELREEREDWFAGGKRWTQANPDDADELADLEADAGDCEDLDDAESRIQDDPLSIEVGGWWSVGGEPDPTEYRILLTTGGPAVRIVGDLGQYNEPASASLEVQDWGKPWTEYPCDAETLLIYVSRLYLGE